MRYAGLMALGVLLSCMFAAQAAGQKKFLVPLPGPIAPKGSLEECIYKQVQQGSTMKHAIEECEVTGIKSSKGDILDLASMFGTGGRKGTGLTIVGCPSSGADPNLAEVPAPEVYSKDRQLNLLWQQIEVWKNIRDSVAYEYVGATTKDQKEAAWGVAITINNEINRQKEEMRPFLEAKAWKEKKDTEPPPPAGDFPTPDPGTAPARDVQGFESPCSQALLFIGECNRDGWRNPDCKALLDRMNKCLDPKVADPANPEERTCGVPAVDSGKVQDVMMVLCSSKKRYGPDDNPCDPRLVKGKARTYWGGRTKFDQCNGPDILRSEACTTDVTVVEFGVPDMEKIRKFGLEKLGGPIFIFPTGTPHGADEPSPKPPPF
jgi:hypothetical protein